ncbi:MAG: putative lipoprotein [Fibrobacteres bacterium]|nr:putative lipoprotein [Fibrobacterota bacterium]
MKTFTERKMHPSLKRLKRCCLSLGLILAACNVFNPSGEGDSGTSDAAQLTDGENFFRAQDYKSAYETFAAAIASDSTSSMAYYGYSKSVMRYWEVNASTLLTEVSKAQDKSGIPFITASDWDITRYLQATSKVRVALGTLTERDTLTRWYYYSLNPTDKNAAKDPLAAQRIAFMTDYWDKADKGYAGYHKKSQFPLSDLKMGYQKVIADFGFVELIYAVTHLRDLNADNIIDSNDNLLKKLTFSVDGGFKVENLKDIVDSLDTPEKKAQFNSLIQNVAGGLSSASTVLDLLSPALANQAGGTDTSKDLSQKVTQNMDSVITSLGDAITFYQFGDERDNDGDGCIDEEIADGKDNDGDGLIDEDARFAPVDQVDNDHNGKGKNAFTDPDAGELLDSEFKLGYTTAAGFTLGALYKDKATHIAVQKDSLQVRYDKVGAYALLSTEYKDKLDSAKKNVGGCWNNYK